MQKIEKYKKSLRSYYRLGVLGLSVVSTILLVSLNSEFPKTAWGEGTLFKTDQPNSNLTVNTSENLFCQNVTVVPGSPAVNDCFREATVTCGIQPPTIKQAMQYSLSCFSDFEWQQIAFSACRCTMPSGKPILGYTRANAKRISPIENSRLYGLLNVTILSDYFVQNENPQSTTSYHGQLVDFHVSGKIQKLRPNTTYAIRLLQNDRSQAWEYSEEETNSLGEMQLVNQYFAIRGSSAYLQLTNADCKSSDPNKSGVCAEAEINFVPFTTFTLQQKTDNLAISCVANPYASGESIIELSFKFPENYKSKDGTIAVITNKLTGQNGFIQFTPQQIGQKVRGVVRVGTQSESYAGIKVEPGKPYRIDFNYFEYNEFGKAETKTAYSKDITPGCPIKRIR